MIIGWDGLRSVATAGGGRASKFSLAEMLQEGGAEGSGETVVDNEIEA